MPRIVSLESAFSPTQDVIGSYMSPFMDKSGEWHSQTPAPAQAPDVRVTNYYSTSSDAISKWLQTRAQWQSHMDMGTGGWNAFALRLANPHDTHHQGDVLSPVTTTTEVDSVGLSTPTLQSNRGVGSVASPPVPSMHNIVECTASGLSSGTRTEHSKSPTTAPELDLAATSSARRAHYTHSDYASEEASPRTAREHQTPDTQSLFSVEHGDDIGPEAEADCTMHVLNLPVDHERPMRRISSFPGLEGEDLGYLRPCSTAHAEPEPPVRSAPVYAFAPRLPEAQAAVVEESWGHANMRNVSQGSWVLPPSESAALGSITSPPPPAFSGADAMRDFSRIEPAMSFTKLQPIADADAYILGMQPEPAAPAPDSHADESIAAPALDTSVLQHVQMLPGSESMPAFNVASGMFEEREHARNIPVLHEIAPTPGDEPVTLPPVSSAAPQRSPAPHLDLPHGAHASPVPWSSAAFFDTVMDRAATDFDAASSEPQLDIKPLFHGRRPPTHSLSMHRRDPDNLFFRSGALGTVECSPVDQLHEFSYIVDDAASDDEPSAAPAPAAADETHAQAVHDAAPTLPPLNFDIPDEEEHAPRRAPALGTFDDDVDLSAAPSSAATSTKLPLDFITRPDSLLARGRPVKKRGDESVFYSAATTPRRRTDFSAEPMFYAPPGEPHKPLDEMNFYERLEHESELEARAVEAAVAAQREHEAINAAYQQEWAQAQPQAQPQPQAQAQPQAQPQWQGSPQGPPPEPTIRGAEVSESKGWHVPDASTPTRARAPRTEHAGRQTPRKFTPRHWWKRMPGRKDKERGKSSAGVHENVPQPPPQAQAQAQAPPSSQPAAAQAPPSSPPAAAQAPPPPRFSTAPPKHAMPPPQWVRMGTPHGRPVRLPQVEPTEPGKYCLADTAALPMLHVARTAEQRRRGETGHPETELRRIQELLAEPSGKTEPARAGIIKTVAVSAAGVPPPGKIMVVEDRKVIVRPVM